MRQWNDKFSRSRIRRQLAIMEHSRRIDHSDARLVVRRINRKGRMS